MSLHTSSKARIADLRFVGRAIDELINIASAKSRAEIDLGCPTKRLEKLLTDLAVKTKALRERQKK